MGISNKRKISDDVELMRALFPEEARYFGVGEGSSAAEESAVLLERAAELGMSDTGDSQSDASELVAESFQSVLMALGSIAQNAPGLSEFIESGWVPEEIRSALEADGENVLVLAPYGVGVATWKEKIREKGAESGITLKIASEIESVFETVDAPPIGVSHLRGKDGVAWTLRVVPGGSTPSVMGHNHSATEHISLAEALTLDLYALGRGRNPNDENVFTWLDNTLDDGKLAARHVFDPLENTIQINCREVSSQGPHLGARPPVT